MTGPLDRLKEWLDNEVGVQSLGDQIMERFIPGSAAATPNAARAAGTVSDKTHWVPNPSNGYLMVVFNDSGATVPLSIQFEWCEEEPA